MRNEQFRAFIWKRHIFFKYREHFEFDVNSSLRTALILLAGRCSGLPSARSVFKLSLNLLPKLHGTSLFPDPWRYQTVCYMLCLGRLTREWSVRRFLDNQLANSSTYLSMNLNIGSLGRMRRAKSQLVCERP